MPGDWRFQSGSGKPLSPELIDEVLREINRLDGRSSQPVQGSLTKAPDGTLIGGAGVPFTKKGDLLQNTGTRLERLVAPTAEELDGQWAALLFNPATGLWEAVVGTEDCNPA